MDYVMNATRSLRRNDDNLFEPEAWALTLGSKRRDAVFLKYEANLAVRAKIEKNLLVILIVWCTFCVHSDEFGLRA